MKKTKEQLQEELTRVRSACEKAFNKFWSEETQKHAALQKYEMLKVEAARLGRIVICWYAAVRWLVRGLFVCIPCYWMGQIWFWTAIMAIIVETFISAAEKSSGSCGPGVSQRIIPCIMRNKS